jgi:hypothetical protein
MTDFIVANFMLVMDIIKKREIGAVGLSQE